MFLRISECSSHLDKGSLSAIFPIKSYFAWTSRALQALKNFSKLLKVIFVVFPPHRKRQSSGGICTETVKGMKTRCTLAAPCLSGINGVRVSRLSVMWRCCQQESESDVNRENSELDLLDRLWLFTSLSGIELCFHMGANALLRAISHLCCIKH